MKVKFIGCNNAQASWGNCDDPRMFLIKDKQYTLVRKEVHTHHTKYFLKEYPSKCFNSVCFQ